MTNYYFSIVLPNILWELKVVLVDLLHGGN
jgi:hypothetical protein